MCGMKGSKGFTIIELMMVVVVVGIFAAIAVPNFVSFINGNKVQSASNELAALLQFARSTAVQNNTTYTVCLSSGVWTVKKGADCTSTTVQRNYTPTSDLTITSSSSAVPMVFAPNGTTQNDPSIIVCKGTVAADGYKIKVRNSGNIRVASRGKSETGAALTSCTP